MNNDFDFPWWSDNLFRPRMTFANDGALTIRNPSINLMQLSALTRTASPACEMLEREEFAVTATEPSAKYPCSYLERTCRSTVGLTGYLRIQNKWRCAASSLLWEGNGRKSRVIRYPKVQRAWTELSQSMRTWQLQKDWVKGNARWKNCGVMTARGSERWLILMGRNRGRERKGCDCLRSRGHEGGRQKKGCYRKDRVSHTQC